MPKSRSHSNDSNRRWWSHWGSLLVTTVLCATLARPITAQGTGPVAQNAAVRVMLSAQARVVSLTSSGPWHIDERGGDAPLVRGTGGEQWRVEYRGSRLLRVVGEGSDATPERTGPFVVRPSTATGTIQVDGKRYRGAIWLVPADGGMMVLNVVAIDDYLAGVVPYELGTGAERDIEALKAQAIAARSFAMARAAERRSRGSGFDLVATQNDQVYGGAGAEQEVASRAIRATTGEVLRVNGRVVAAPFYSACGGQTADPADAWEGTEGSRWLRSVSDRIPGTDRAYCDIAPRANWRTGFSAADVERALASVGRQRGREMGRRVRELSVADRSSTGRASIVLVTTETGTHRLRGPELRMALRGARGEMVASTAFSVANVERRADQLVWLELAGVGHGHGVGMCQWGAIGRARAGQDYRTILRAYYPGATLDRLD
jgi:stage II sporulation protein D